MSLMYYIFISLFLRLCCFDDSVHSVINNDFGLQYLHIFDIRYTQKTSCSVKAQQTPPPCCASRHRTVSRNWPKM